MVYELILIIASLQGHQSVSMGIYDTMDECFNSREAIVKIIGRPIINYQAVCLIEQRPGTSPNGKNKTGKYTL